MKKTTISILLATAVIAGCSTNEPVKTGMNNEIVYQSDDRPGWASKGFYTEDGYAYAVGISNKMPSEKTARESAVTNAMGNLAAAIKSEGVKDNFEVQKVEKASDSKSNQTINTAEYSTQLHAKEWIKKPVVTDSYFEIWQDKENENQFFKHYVLVKSKI